MSLAGQTHSRQPSERGLLQHYPDTRHTEQSSDAAVDIVAIHGLATQAPKTWMAWINGKDNLEGEINWLSDPTMLPSVVPDARILSYNWSACYHGEDVSSDRFIHEADRMLLSLHDERESLRRSRKPIIFICSCFGGLLLAKALPRAYAPYHPGYKRSRNIADLTVGIMFLGTPFRGSWEFGYANTEAQIEFAQSKNNRFSRELVQYLRPGGRSDANGGPSPLDEVTQTFTEMVKHKQFGCPVVCVFETKPAMYSSLAKNLPAQFKPKGFESEAGFAVTVPETSAALDGFERIAIGVRHNMLSKYSNPRDDGFVCISSRIREFVRWANQTLHTKATEQERAHLTMSSQFAAYIEAEIYSNRQQAIFAKREPGTCMAYLQSSTFLNWRDGSEKSTLICQGEPGAGKTVFASVVINELKRLTIESRRNLLAYIYLDYAKFGGEKEVSTLLCSILKQLLMIDIVLPEDVSHLYNRLTMEGRQPNPEETTTAIFELISEFPGRTFIVVDALDECSQKVSKELLEALSTLQNTANLSIMITSRFKLDIEKKFQQSLVTHQRMHGMIADIKRFLSSEIQTLSPFFEEYASEDIKGRVVDTIAKSSEGMWQLARLQLDSLASFERDDDVVSALEDYSNPRLLESPLSSSQSITERAAQLYDMAYGKTVSRINTMPTGDPELARKALAWVLYSPFRLTSEQLRHALSLRIVATRHAGYKAVLSLYSNIEGILRKCAGLLKVENTTVRLAHYTTKEFLLTNISRIGRNPATSSSNDPEGAKQQYYREISKILVGYLSLDTFSNATNYGSRESELQREAEYPLFDYAKSHLVHYASLTRFEEDAELISMFTSYFLDEQKIKAAGRFLYTPRGRNERRPRFSATSGPPGLVIAAYLGLTGVAELLLARQSSIGEPPTAAALLNCTDDKGYTALCWAARTDNYSLAKRLLQEEAVNLTHKSSDEGPPLLIAAHYGALSTFELILRATRAGAGDALFYYVALGNISGVARLLNCGVHPDEGVRYPLIPSIFKFIEQYMRDYLIHDINAGRHLRDGVGIEQRSLTALMLAKELARKPADHVAFTHDKKPENMDEILSLLEHASV